MASSCHRLMATSCARDFQNNIRAEPVQDSTASTSIRPSLIGCTTGAPHLSTKASFFFKENINENIPGSSQWWWHASSGDENLRKQRRKESSPLLVIVTTDVGVLFGINNERFWPVLANFGSFVANSRKFWCTFYWPKLCSGEPTLKISGMSIIPPHITSSEIVRQPSPCRPFSNPPDHSL